MSYEEITELSGAIAEYDEYVRGVDQQISGLRAGALRANASE
jgi:hypothetical protein